MPAATVFFSRQASASDCISRASTAATITSAARACAIVAFQRDAEPEFRDRRAVDALRTGLHEGPRPPPSFMILVSIRSVPATMKGSAMQAVTSRCAAFARSAPSPTPVAMREKTQCQRIEPLWHRSGSSSHRCRRHHLGGAGADR